MLFREAKKHTEFNKDQRHSLGKEQQPLSRPVKRKCVATKFSLMFD